MKRLGIVILAPLALAGCTSNFAGPVVTPGHPAHPDSAHAMAPAPPSPFSLEPPYLALAEDSEMHDMHTGHGDEMRHGDAHDASVDDGTTQHDGYDGHNPEGGAS